MEESVLNDLDRLLFCELSFLYKISKNLSDESSQLGESRLQQEKQTSKSTRRD